MFSRFVVLAFIAPAFAGHPSPKPAPDPVTVNQPVAVAGAAAGAKADADAKANSVAVSNAEGGDASSDASSNSGGNTLEVNERHVRQAPGLAQGSFAIVGCGVAGNAGASGPGGAGFLGFGFTPQQCYDFMLANAYCTAGATEACCEVLNNSKAGQRARKRGVRLPECRPPEPPKPCCEQQQTPPPPTVVVVPAPCCDKPECEGNHCYEKCDKACKQQCDGNAACESRCEKLCKRRCDGEPPSPAGSGVTSCPVPGSAQPEKP